MDIVSLAKNAGAVCEFIEGLDLAPMEKSAVLQAAKGIYDAQVAMQSLSSFMASTIRGDK